MGKKPTRKRNKKTSPRLVRAPLCKHSCRKGTIRRGNCQNCYMAMYRMVAAGDTTLEELESKGLIAPSRRGHWPDSSCSKARQRVLEALAKS